MKTSGIIFSIICVVLALFICFTPPNNEGEKITPIKDTTYIINNMKYIIIKGNVINVTKDSLECKFYKDEENF